MPILRTTISVVAASLAAFAASGVRGPVQGYLVDSRIQAIRAINGIPGAAVLGEPFGAGKISTGAFHSESATGIVVSEGRAAIVRGLSSDEPSLTNLDGAIAQPDLIAIDSAGKTGVLVSKANGKLQFVAGLAGTPEALAPVQLGEFAARVRSVAIDAKRALLAVADPDGGVYQVTRDGGIDLVARASGVSALSLLADGSGLVFADIATQQVLRTHGIHGGAATSVLASGRDGVVEPVGLSVVGRRAYVADAGSQNILTIDLDSNLLDKGIELSAAPSRVQAIDGGNSLVLTEIGDSPLLLLDTTGSPRVFFVPVVRE